MHSIERYGIVALLFLVVTVVAVLMWDGGKDTKAKDPGAGTAPPAAAAHKGETAAERRLSLLAESRPGPLARNGRARREVRDGQLPETRVPAGDEREMRDVSEEIPAEAETLAPSAFETLEAAGQPAPDPALRKPRPREEPAREEVIGQARSGATHAYTVQSGDTLSEIALRQLGSSRRWQEIVAANPGLDPGRLQVGKPLVIPGKAAVPAKAEAHMSAASVASRSALSADAKQGADAKAADARVSWKVGKGENLWKIAEKSLGDGKRWREIAALNPKVDPDRLLLGQVLVLPAAGAASATKVASAPPVSKKAPANLVASNSDQGASRRGGKVK